MGTSEATKPGRQTRVRIRFLAGVVVGVAVLAVPAAALGTQSGPALTPSDPPPEPRPCPPYPRPQSQKLTSKPAVAEMLCGSRQGDRFTLEGGGDGVEAYAGNDWINAANGKPDEIYGHQGRDTAKVDPCDNVYMVEVKRPSGLRCEGVEEGGQRSLQAGSELPYDPPVIECWTEEDGSRYVAFLLEPQMRALDVTKRVDFQTVAWQPALLKQVEGGWVEYANSDAEPWFWDRVYDRQVRSFPGNFWRDFETGRRMFVHFKVDEPGTYVAGAYLHWYKTPAAQAADADPVARAHYGPNASADDQSCVFPA
jgi:hypothetical protein